MHDPRSCATAQHTRKLALLMGDLDPGVGLVPMSSMNKSLQESQHRGTGSKKSPCAL